MVITFLTKAMLLVGGLLTSILYARLLGAEGKGLFTAILVFPQLVLNLGRLGVKRSIALAIGKNLYSDDKVYGSSLFLCFLTSIISIGVIIFYFNFVSATEYSWGLIGIVLALIPLQFFDNYVSGTFEGREQIIEINLINHVKKVIEIASIFLLIYLLDFGLYGAVFTQFLMYLTIAILSIYFVNKVHKSIKLKIDAEVCKFLFTNGVKYAIPFFLLSLIYKVDILILERMVSASHVGVYSIGVAVAQLIWQVPTTINIVLFSRILNTRKSEDAVNRTTQLLRLLVPFVLLAGILLFFFANIFVSIFYGEEFIESTLVIQVLLPGIIALVFSKIIHADIQGRGEPLFVLMPFIVALSLNIILNLILIPEYGIVGAAFASSLSYVVEAALIIFKFKKKFSLPFAKMLVINKDDIRLIVRKLSLRGLANEDRKN